MKCSRLFVAFQFGRQFDFCLRQLSAHHCQEWFFWFLRTLNWSSWYWSVKYEIIDHIVQYSAVWQHVVTKTIAYNVESKWMNFQDQVLTVVRTNLRCAHAHACYMHLCESQPYSSGFARKWPCLDSYVSHYIVNLGSQCNGLINFTFIRCDVNDLFFFLSRKRWT